MVVFGQSGCIRAKVVVFWQKWLYSKRSDCIRAKVVAFGQSGCIRAKVVVLGQKWLYSGKVLYSEKSGCILEKWLYSWRVVVFL